MNFENLLQLQKAVSESSQFNYPSTSRVHPLRSFPNGCYVKREDELGFGISGSKIRKYRSLLPSLVERKIDAAIIIGGAFSNNVLGLVQLLIENGIEPILFLRGDADTALQGTYLLSRLFVNNESIHWISRTEWPKITLVQDYATHLHYQGKRAVIIPEGSSMSESLPGSLTLAFDILDNEKLLGKDFDHIVIDAGTGMTAAALLLAYTWISKPVMMHVVQLAGEKNEFKTMLTTCHGWLESLLKGSIPYPKNYQVISPIIGRSFGAVNESIIQSVHHIAKHEGFLTDPIYSAKLFATAREHVQSFASGKNTLIVHSGGGLALSGFQEMLRKGLN